MVGFVPEIRNHTMQLEQSPAVSQATVEVTAAQSVLLCAAESCCAVVPKHKTLDLLL